MGWVHWGVVGGCGVWGAGRKGGVVCKLHGHRGQSLGFAGRG